MLAQWGDTRPETAVKALHLALRSLKCRPRPRVIANGCQVGNGEALEYIRDQLKFDQIWTPSLIVRIVLQIDVYARMGVRIGIGSGLTILTVA